METDYITLQPRRQSCSYPDLVRMSVDYNFDIFPVELFSLKGVHLSIMSITHELHHKYAILNYNTNMHKSEKQEEIILQFN